MNRPTVIAGNWKMNKTAQEAVDFIGRLSPEIEGIDSHIYLAVPFTAMLAAYSASRGTKILVGAQNMHCETQGAFTGEISSQMLVEAGAQFVILGHSERRCLFHESNGFIQKKISRALKDQLQPILCIGETEEERKNLKTEAALKKQLDECLDGIDVDHLACLILAYEPVWAIGTGDTATPETAQQAHRFCREHISKKFGEDAGESLPILYGGSVNDSNATSLIDQPDIDGFLIGGASLDPEGFSKILWAVNHQMKG